jgi:hypothetical protein
VRRAAAFGGALCARPLHQNLPHRIGGDRHEMRAVLHVEAARAHEPRPGLVGERCGLQCVSPPFVPHLTARDPPQLVVHERGQLIQGIGVPLARRSQEPHERIGVGSRHACTCGPADAPLTADCGF